MKNVPSFLALAISLSLTGSAWAQAQSISSPPSVALTNAVQSVDYSRFRPRPSSDIQIDYETWDSLLKEMVYYGGPSLRLRAPRPSAVVGTRFVFGHTSPYRLEGNRILFERINPTFKTYIDDYVADLVDVGNRIDIPSLSKDEQLAYWFNLHNALIIKTIADEYPTGNPSRIKGPDGLPLHDSKLVEIDGVALSLRNIRQDIVYRNWSDPMVIYGFFHGDIGSPSVQRKAFTGRNIDATLKFAATEFVNSLRGFHIDGNKARISRHYWDASPYFFADYDPDIRAHLSSLMDDDVRGELASTRGAVTFMRHETDTADLTNGDDGRKPYSQVQSSSGLYAKPLSSTLSRAIKEQREKMNKIRQRGLLGTVTIEDIQTVPSAPDEDETTEKSETP